VVTSTNESQQSILTTVQQEMAQRRKQKTANGNAVVLVKNGTVTTTTPMSNGISNNGSPVIMTRQDSRLSVKSLIESIENTSKQPKVSTGSQSGSNTSLNNLSGTEQLSSEKISLETDREKSKVLTNNNSIANNNNNIISTNAVVVNGTPKSGGEQN
jgi:cytospin